MKKISKKLSSFILLITIFFISITNITALNRYSYSIGTDYSGFWPWDWDIDTTDDAILASNAFANMGWSSYYNGAPTYTYLTGKNPNRTSLYRMESSILFFSGHGNNQSVVFNYKLKGGDYKTGVYYSNTNWTSSTSGYKYVGLGKYRMSEVNLIVFGACETAKGSSNIAQYAEAQGADTTIGWTVSIGASSHSKWFNNFLYKLKQHSTVQEAVNYANGFTYSDNGVKNAKIYGDRHLRPRDLYLIAMSSNVTNGIQANEYYINKNIQAGVSKESFVKSEVQNYLKKNVDNQFNLDNYVVETTETDNGKIYDFVLYVDGVRTDLGYTVFEENNVITNVYDNTNGLSENNIVNKIQIIKSLNNISSSQKSNIKKRALIKAETEYEGYRISVLKEFEYFNTGENKLYYVIRSEIYDINAETKYVIDYQEEVQNVNW